MRLTLKTRFLVGAALGLAGLSVLWPAPESVREELPSISPLSFRAVQRVELTSGADDKITITRVDEESWRLESPVVGPADAQMMRSLLRQLNRGVPMDARIDDGDLDREELASFGLGNADRLLFEAFGEGELPLVSFSIGGDAPGGASFVRLSGDEAVYRAMPGSRARYAKPPAAWRNKMVTLFETEDVRELKLTRPGGELHFVEEEGFWGLQGAEMEVDQDTVEALAFNLSHIRAGELLSSGFDADWESPAASVEFTFADGETTSLTFGGMRQGPAAFVRRDGQGYRVSASKLDQLLRPLESFRVLQLLDTSPLDLRSVSIQDAGIPRTLARSEDNLWFIETPANLEGNLSEIASGLGALCNLRAAGRIDPEEIGGFPTPVATFTITFNDGSEERIELGPGTVDEQGRQLVMVRKGNTGELFAVRFEAFAPIFTAFGRGM